MSQGKIVQIIGAVVDVEFPRESRAEGVRRAEGRQDTEITLEVQQQLGDGIVRTIALGSTDGLKRNLIADNTGAGDLGAGRQGHAGPHHGRARRPDRRSRPGRARRTTGKSTAPRRATKTRPRRNELLETGIKVIDLMCPFAKGGKVGLFGGAGVGKTVNMMELINNIANAALGSVGVRRRRRAYPRGQRLLPRDAKRLQRRLGQGGDGVRPDERAAGQPPARRADRPDHGRVLPRREGRVGKGRDVLLFVDNIYRYTLAGTEVSALLGRMPSAVGYQPTLAEEMGVLQERITSTKTGSITSIQAVYVPADDLTDPSPATTFAHLDATVVLSRNIASLGIYPAVDPLDSTSRQLDPNVIGNEHYDTARRVQAHAAEYKELKDIIAILGMDELSRRRQAGRVARAQDRALLLAAVPRRRSVHRLAGQVRLAEGHDPRLQDDRRRRVRPPAGAGVLHGRRHRRSLREGRRRSACVTDR